MLTLIPYTKYTDTSTQGRSLNTLKIGLRFTPFLKQNIKLGQSKKQKKKLNSSPALPLSRPLVIHSLRI